MLFRDRPMLFSHSIKVDLDLGIAGILEMTTNENIYHFQNWCFKIFAPTRVGGLGGAMDGIKD